MIQRTLTKQSSPRLHTAIIMDGNGRWAARRGMPRNYGHRAGADAVRRVVQAAPELGIDTLTLYAFSADNWRRPEREVSSLMRLFHSYLLSETEKCVEHGIRLNVIGRRDRLSPGLVEAVIGAEEATAGGAALHLNIAIDYSARDSIMAAASLAAGLAPCREAFASAVAIASNQKAACSDVDLLIRTGGEQRLSDFMLWESAYAELYFTEKMWPDFGEADLEQALAAFHSRERRFGRIPEAAAV